LPTTITTRRLRFSGSISLYHPPLRSVYKRVTGSFFAVSGFYNKRICYNRCNFAGAFIHCILLNYPANEKRQWDYVVTKISHTLAR
jgi:hypothetical protein